MNKRFLFMLVLLVSLLLSSSCNGNGGIAVSEENRADTRIEQIISTIQDEDKEELKSLFSKKALDEANDFDGEIDCLFEFLEGDIISWERNSWASSESTESGKRSLMIRPDFKVVTDVEEYCFFLIDYTIDTIDPDNEGVYMLEVSKSSYSGEWDSWQKRMCAGISIVE